MSRVPPLLARYAEGMFWLARYVERIENTARLVDVTQTFENPGREADTWYGLVRINADEESFAKHGLTANAASIKRYYITDRGNPTSIAATMEAARTNARTLRPVISTEMWLHLNVFHRYVINIPEDALEGDALSRTCRQIKEGIQAHTGITEGTLFRDQGHHFYQIGRLIERADQTTRLLDIKYHQLTAGTFEERRLRELTQWSAVLRAAAGFHAFRRIAPVAFTPVDVLDFMIHDPGFPRSVAVCISEIEQHLHSLRTRYGLRGTVDALEWASEMRAGIVGRRMDTILSHGLHEFLDGVQQDLIRLAAIIGTCFFRDWRPLLTQTQSQSQSQSGGGSQSQTQSQTS